MKRNRQFNSKVKEWLKEFTLFYDEISNNYRSLNWDREEKDRVVDKIHLLKYKAEKLNELIHYRDHKPEHCLIRNYQAWAKFYIWERHSPVEIFRRFKQLCNNNSAINYGKYLIMNCRKVEEVVS